MSSKGADRQRMWLQCGFLVLLATTPFVVARTHFDVANLPQSIWIQSGVCCLVILWCAKQGFGQAMPVYRCRSLLALVGVWGWAALSMSWAHNGYEAAVVVIHWGFCLAAGFLVFQIRAPIFNRRLLDILIGIGAAVAIIGILQHIADFQFYPQAISPASTFVNKNMACQVVILMAPLPLVSFVVATDNRAIWMYALAAVAMTLFLFYSATKSAWLAYTIQIVGLAACYWGHQLPRARWSKAHLYSTLLSACMLLILVNRTPDGWRRAVSDATDSVTDTIVEAAGTEGVVMSTHADGRTTPNSIAIRKAIWSNTLAMAKTQPIHGVGAGNFEVIYPKFAQSAVADPTFTQAAKWRNAHNDYLEVAAELGVIGIGLGIFALLVLVVEIRRGFANPDTDKRLLVAAALSLLGFGIVALFSFPLYRAVPPFVAMTLIGAMLAETSRASSTTFQLSPPMAKTAMVILAIAGLWCADFNYGRLAADRALAQMVDFEEAGKWKDMLVAGGHAVTRNPYDKRLAAAAARAMQQLGNFDQAIEHSEAALVALPYHLNTLVDVGNTYFYRREFDRANAYYQRALEIQPESPRVHNNIGVMLQQQGRLEDALDAYSKAATYDLEQVGIHINRGAVLMKLKRYNEAADAFAQELKRAPQSPVAHQFLGRMLYEHLGQADRGVAHMEKALQLKPDLRGGNRLRDMIRSHRQGQAQ